MTLTIGKPTPYRRRRSGPVDDGQRAAAGARRNSSDATGIELSSRLAPSRPYRRDLI